jgi:hypothetical protein
MAERYGLECAWRLPLNVYAGSSGFKSALDATSNFPYNFPNMHKDEIGTLELAVETGLSQRLIRYLAKARKIPWPVTRPERRGFWFEREKLKKSGWIREHTVDPCEPRSRGRKRKAAYLNFRSLLLARPAVLSVPELAAFSKTLVGKLNRIAPRLTISGSKQMHDALKPLSQAILKVGSKHVDDEIRKFRLRP